MERRQKGTGQVTRVPCRWCGTPVELDHTAMTWHDDQPFLTCPGCEVEVPVRHNDGFAPIEMPATAPNNIRTLTGRPFSS